MAFINKRFSAAVLAAVLLLALLSGCAAPAQNNAPKDEQQNEYVDKTELGQVSIDEDEVALAEVPAVINELAPVASGRLVKDSAKAAIDYSNTTDGYVMVRFSAASEKKIKAQVTGPSGVTYTYNLDPGSEKWTTFPLSDGNGGYKVTVFENTSGTKYATVVSVTFTVALKDEFAPFLLPNQYVDYSDAPDTVAKAAELTKGIDDPLLKVQAIYNFVVKNITYDKAKAESVKSGYLPVLDAVLKEKTGICFDYASLMTAMLRAQGVPCKLVVGYAGTAYHAWINVWTEENGWIDAAIFFDGSTWQRMDPTFAASGKQSEAIMKYIGDGTNYTAKYLY